MAKRPMTPHRSIILVPVRDGKNEVTVGWFGHAAHIKQVGQIIRAAHSLDEIVYQLMEAGFNVKVEKERNSGPQDRN